jgi:hypothetical protein
MTVLAAKYQRVVATLMFRHCRQTRRSRPDAGLVQPDQMTVTQLEEIASGGEWDSGALRIRNLPGCRVRWYRPSSLSTQAPTMIGVGLSADLRAWKEGVPLFEGRTPPRGS